MTIWLKPPPDLLFVDDTKASLTLFLFDEKKRTLSGLISEKFFLSMAQNRNSLRHGSGVQILFMNTKYKLLSGFIGWAKNIVRIVVESQWFGYYSSRELSSPIAMKKLK